MSRADQLKWDHKWGDLTGDVTPSRLLITHERLFAGGHALDLACGRGQNTVWLAQHGYAALGVDISPVALASARSLAEPLGLLGDGPGQVAFRQVDLDDWRPAPLAFDLVAVFRFLDRRLFPALRAAIRPGGLLVYETRHSGVLARCPGSTPEFLLRPGELHALVAGWMILDYREDETNAAIVARCP
jgi:SAM-dependent methyltransferase